MHAHGRFLLLLQRRDTMEEYGSVSAGRPYMCQKEHTDEKGKRDPSPRIRL